MSEIGQGLFNRDMMRSIKDRWHNGGIGILYVRIDAGSVEAEWMLHDWSNDEPGIFWRQRLDMDFVFLLERQQRVETVVRLAEAAAARLQKYVSGKMEKLQIGLAAAFPSLTGRSSETVFYRALLEAMEQQTAAVAGTSHHAASPDEWLNPAVSRSVQDKIVRIGSLAIAYPLFPAGARVSEVAYLFDTNKKTHGAVIVEQGRPIGILMKEKLHQMLAGQFGLPLYWNKPVERIMNSQPLVVDEQMPVEQVSQLAMARDFSQLYDVVLITKEGKMAGAASIRSILECMTTLRTEAARGANPLTGLPGNEAIQLELRRRIDKGKPFAVVYADLDYFKWYNDYFGFSRGDELIRYLAKLLQQEMEKSGDGEGFVGHIGGDDFIAVTDYAYGEKLCQSLIAAFDLGVTAFYGGTRVTEVEDRYGNRISHEGVTLSLSLMACDGGMPLKPEEISEHAAKLKKQAKACKGSVYVMKQITGMQVGEERKQS
jgi:diguanylate cyclase (GGDEF)-like protein